MNVDQINKTLTEELNYINSVKPQFIALRDNQELLNKTYGDKAQRMKYALYTIVTTLGWYQTFCEQLLDGKLEYLNGAMNHPFIPEKLPQDILKWCHKETERFCNDLLKAAKNGKADRYIKSWYPFFFNKDFEESTLPETLDFSDLKALEKMLKENPPFQNFNKMYFGKYLWALLVPKACGTTIRFLKVIGKYLPEILKRIRNTFKENQEEIDRLFK